MNNKYSNPPFLEAVFEIHTTNEENDWDLTFHGSFHEEIKDIFPNRKTEKRPNLAISFTPKGIDVSPNIDERHILKSSTIEGNVVVQFSENQLVVNATQPYVNWDIYYYYINRCLEAYMKVVEPNHISNLSLRYINKIDSGNEHSYENLEKIFNIRPFIPDNISSKTTSFQMITEYLLEEESAILAIQQASLRPNNKMNAPILFDLRYFQSKLDTFRFEMMKDWLNTAHSHIEDAFEKGLSEFIKQKFNS
jgi:uncharacterized protein (TIGR04255 family)